MEIIENNDSVIFILPFKMKYFYLYNDEYFKNKGVNAKISVLMKRENILKGGGETEEKIKTLSVPYKYIYFIMEKIRRVFPSLPSLGSQEKVSDEKVFTTYVDEKQKEANGTPEKKDSFFGMLNPFNKSETKKEDIENIGSEPTAPPMSSETKKEEPSNQKTSSMFNIFGFSETKKDDVENIGSQDAKSENIQETQETQIQEPTGKEPLELKEVDTKEIDVLEKNSENLLFKIEIFGNIKKVNLENKEYIEREKIINEIVLNNNVNNGEHGIENTNEEPQQEPLKKSGGIYNVNNTIIIIGELATEEIDKLKYGIENTEAYNKLLL
jgi:hypothetical protein